MLHLRETLRAGGARVLAPLSEADHSPGMPQGEGPRERHGADRIDVIAQLCPACGERFSDAAMLDEHWYAVPGTGLLRCVPPQRVQDWVKVYDSVDIYGVTKRVGVWRATRKTPIAAHAQAPTGAA
jgi:hypothetical protein